MTTQFNVGDKVDWMGLELRKYKHNLYVSNCGRVFNEKMKEYKTNISYRGYMVLCHFDSQYRASKTMLVHRLVASLFLPINTETEKTQVNHKDGNKLNNNYSNLEWVSPRENVIHSYVSGLAKVRYGEELGHKMSQLKSLDVWCEAISGKKRKDIAKKHGICEGSVSDILNGKTWKRSLATLVLLFFGYEYLFMGIRHDP